MRIRKVSLNGLIQHHQKMLLSIQLKHIDFLDKHIEDISNEIDERLKDEQEIIELIDELPGIGKRSAEYIISEIGTDMSRFPTANHLCSWAGLCPGNNESAGKKKLESLGYSVAKQESPVGCNIKASAKLLADFSSISK